VSQSRKLLITISSLAFLFTTGRVFAADLNYIVDTDVLLTSPAITITIKAGSAATTLVVNAGNITATLPAAATFHVESSGRLLVMTGHTDTLTTTCTAGVSSLSLTTSGIQSITITPGGAQCTASSGEPTSVITSSGSVRSTPRAPARTAPAAPTVVPTVYKFTRNLHFQMIGADVKELQKYLNSRGFVVAQIGVGSPGKETNYFGTLTKAALIKFQEAYATEILIPAGLIKGTGYFGPSTRAFVNK
jgi:hypothetical protein